MTQVAERNPSLTIVVAGRNDDYGATFSARFQTFLRHLASLSEEHKALFDLIVVEWNPPADRSSMLDAFDWTGLPMSRLVTVSPEIHASIPIPGNMPLLEFVAKNVGVRRAKTPYVLSTNPDVILSPAFFDFIAEDQLSPKAYYRADRYDFAPELAFAAPGPRIFDLAVQSVFEVHTRNTIDLEEPMSHFVDPGEPLDQWPQSQPIYKETLTKDGATIISGRRQNPLSGLHTQASGDFIMASKEAWASIRGHWERTDTYTHLDSFLVCHFHAGGFEQRILRRPTMVLHMDHSRDDHKSRPRRPYEETLAEIRQAAAGALPNPNDENWGLAHLTLPETRPSRRRARKGAAKPALAAATVSAADHVKELSRIHALAAAQRADAGRKRSGLDQQVAQLQARLQEALEAKAEHELRVRAAEAEAGREAALRLAEERASEASALQTRIADMEGELIQLRDQSGAQALTSAQAEEAAVLRGRLADMEAEAERLRGGAEDARAEASKIAEARAQEAAALHAKVVAMETEVARLRDESRTKARVVDAQRQDALRLARERALEAEALQTRLAEMEVAAARLRDGAATSSAEKLPIEQALRISELQQSLAVAHGVAEKFKERVEQARADAGALQQRAQALEAERRVAVKVCQEREEELARTQGGDEVRTAALTQDAAGWRERANGLEVAHKAAVAMAEERLAQATDLEQALARAEAVSASLQAMLEELQAENMALLASKQTLEQEHAAALQLAEERARRITELQHALAQAQVDSVAAEEQERIVGELRRTLGHVETANATLQRLVEGLENENAALLRTRDALEQEYTRITKQAEDRAGQITTLQAAVSNAEAKAAAERREREAIKGALAQAISERDDLRAVLSTEREALAEHRGRVDLLQNRISQLRAEADDAQTVAREAADRHAAERMAADKRYEEVIRLLGQARAEELEQIRATYEQRMDSLVRAAAEAERIAAQLDAERRGYRDVTAAQQLAEQALGQEKERRATAETLLRALETEGVEREQRVGALETALSEARQALAEASAERDRALATYRNIVENSRYLKARRALISLLKRG